MSKRVLVTGATGFIAGEIIAELLERGYRVRGTVRDLAATGKRAHLESLDGELEFAAANLDSESGWAAAADGCDFVVHVASPFPPGPPENEQQMIDTAVQGTLRVLRASAAAGTVRRIVLTSSIAAIAYGHNDDRERTEEDWTVAARAAAYQKSKTLAERAAWDWAATQPGPELTVINPGMVLGPVRSSDTSTSHEPVRRLLLGDMPGVPRVGWSPVDVRDLATAHRLALETPVAAGNRYICAGSPLWMRDMASALAADFGPQGFRVPQRKLPDLAVRAVAVFDKGVRLTVPTLGRTERVSAAKAQRELGWSMRPVRESLRDTAQSLIDHGIVPARTSAAAPAGRM